MIWCNTASGRCTNSVRRTGEHAGSCFQIPFDILSGSNQLAIFFGQWLRCCNVKEISVFGTNIPNLFLRVSHSALKYETNEASCPKIIGTAVLDDSLHSPFQIAGDLLWRS